MRPSPLHSPQPASVPQDIPSSTPHNASPLRLLPFQTADFFCHFISICLCMLQRHTEAEPFLLCGGEFSFRCGHLGLRRGKLFLGRLLLPECLFQLPRRESACSCNFSISTARLEQAGIPCQRAAGQRAAGIDHLTVQRNNAKAIAITPSNCFTAESKSSATTIRPKIELSTP